MMTGVVDDAEINISHLSGGFFIVKVIDRSGNIYNLKLQKL